MLPMINRNCMIRENEPLNKAEIIEKMVNVFHTEGYLNDRDLFHKDILAREEVFSTYIGYGIGLPHGKSDAVKDAGIAVAKLKHPLTWNEASGESVDLILMIAVKAGEGNDLHLQVISKLSRLLMHEDFRDQLKNGDLDELHAVLTEKLS